MTDQSSGDLSPGTAPSPQSTPPPPQTFEQRRQAQERMHTPPPRQRQPQAPNPNAARDAPPGVGKNFADADTIEGRYRIAAEARRAAALASDGTPPIRPREIPALPPIAGRATLRRSTNSAMTSN